ncbi:NAD dependent epimerase/dehydratase family protein [Pedococcus dokdonensis]|uniref:NAD dependent epimerase/dehydratase family protein n=1 Tax=Pedococcus dokdonensis TaxID=443156 RepID=A0A1H0L1X6_9MICO|nr:NAD-dependent epimerase/dehydratase family protein [Pedococcus dokdonensis]SDO62294.1 NAD dependent epimerase/dehydratase family protein [Pedococcus dokdonensis]
MSSPGRAGQGTVRSRRSAIDVAVIGTADPASRAVLRALVSAAARGTTTAQPGGVDGEARIGTVVAVGPEPATVGGVEHRHADPATPGLAAALTGLHAAAYIATSTNLERDLALGARARRERNLRVAQTVITSAAAAGLRHLVVVTSAQVFGASVDNPVPLEDDAPLRAASDEGQVGDLMDVEQLVAVAREVHPGLTITAVRPAALVGDGVDTVITRHFEAPRLLTLRGAEPAWQFCHVDDLGSAVALVLAQGVGGAVSVGADGHLTQRDLERITGMRQVELSLGAAMGTADRLHRVGVLPAPASDLAFVAFPWAVSAHTLRGRGWVPVHDNETCLGVLLETIRGSHAVAARRLDRKDAALGAASAAVALVGTAAIMRRRRRKGSTA